MSFMPTFTLLLSVFLVFPILYLSFCIRRPCGRPPETITTPESIRLLLDPPRKIEVLLRLRALPNERLIRAFGIHNSTFTSSSTNVRDKFRKNTTTRLRRLDTPGNWQTLRGVIKDIVEFYLPDHPNPGHYATYMQAITFVAVLVAFFDHEIPSPEASQVRFVTEGINTLWNTSKTRTFDPSSPTLAQINQYLSAWIPDNPSDPFHKNPLELILPAYETLWRLVAHTFTYVEGSPMHTRTFVDFFDDPIAAQFMKPGTSESPSVHDIVQEALRLHPPTKRIKRGQDNMTSIAAWNPRRLFRAAGFTCDYICSSTVAADIEALQRSSVWGPSPHDFDAKRHKASTEAQKECFLPFGLGPLKCVASALAPRLAGMIIAGVASRDDIELTRSQTQGGREGWEGWMICRRS
ncbi:hypothetical protein JB92DRAFT_653469 [Gautieria morchelliformis]|nr:hypothetical protein JB92DRAFT_653469 [Gautieria morchelliformis]